MRVNIALGMTLEFDVQANKGMVTLKIYSGEADEIKDAMPAVLYL